jgi:hypothetical protein
MKAKETGIPLSSPSAMTEERISQLEELGFVWALRGDAKRDADDFDASEEVIEEPDTIQDDDDNLNVTSNTLSEPTQGELLEEVVDGSVVDDPLMRDAMEHAEI